MMNMDEEFQEDENEEDQLTTQEKLSFFFLNEGEVEWQYEKM